jgi:dimethylhistidine N-methyltransferase
MGTEAPINIPSNLPSEEGTAPFQIFDLKPEPADVEAEVLAGLKAVPKQLSPKFFYDEKGSQLFEAITRLPEYYLTRTELSIFDACLDALAAEVPEASCVVEYGSGSSLKIRKVLEAVEPAAYVPVDISGEHMAEMAHSLAADFPGLAIYPTCADFTSAFELPPPVAQLPKVGFFPGSSIGNFEPAEAAAFLGRVARTLGPGGKLIVGVDQKKDIDVLEAAYDDAAGVTAQFNLNVISHLAETLQIEMEPSRFAHRAEYNDELGAIQMFLDVRESHDVKLAGESIRLQKGEAIHTENSFKYDPAEFRRLAARAGFREAGRWTDSKGWFAVCLLEVEGPIS